MEKNELVNMEVISTFKIDIGFEQKLEELNSFVAHYSGIAISEDNIADIKSVRAKMNKKVDELKVEFKNLKELWNRPLVEAEKKFKKLYAIPEALVKELDVDLIAYEGKRKNERMEEIKTFYQSLESRVELERVFDTRWLNKTCDKKQWTLELETIIEKTRKDIEYIESKNDKTFQVLAKQHYEKTLDLLASIGYAEQLTQKIEDVPLKKETPLRGVEEVRGWMEQTQSIKRFAIHFDSEIDYKLAVALLEENGIEFTSENG